MQRYTGLSLMVLTVVGMQAADRGDGAVLSFSKKSKISNARSQFLTSADVPGRKKLATFACGMAIGSAISFTTLDVCSIKKDLRSFQIALGFLVTPIVVSAYLGSVGRTTKRLVRLEAKGKEAAQMMVSTELNGQSASNSVLTVARCKQFLTDPTTSSLKDDDREKMYEAYNLLIDRYTCWPYLTLGITIGGILSPLWIMTSKCNDDLYNHSTYLDTLD